MSTTEKSLHAFEWEQLNMELKHCLDYFGISSGNMDNNLYCQIDGIVCMYVYTCVVVILVFSKCNNVNYF